MMMWGDKFLNCSVLSLLLVLNPKNEQLYGWLVGGVFLLYSRILYKHIKQITTVKSASLHLRYELSSDSISLTMLQHSYTDSGCTFQYGFNSTVVRMHLSIHLINFESHDWMFNWVFRARKNWRLLFLVFYRTLRYWICLEVCVLVLAIIELFLREIQFSLDHYFDVWFSVG